MLTEDELCDLDITEVIQDYFAKGMPIQAPQWTDYLNCPVCCREFGAPPRSPISLNCGHTLCRHCLKQLHRKQCPFDQTVIQLGPEELVVNTALLQLAGYAPPTQPYHPPCIQALPEHDRQAYDVIVRCMEQLAAYLKYGGNPNNSVAGNRLSRPMQRKLVTLLQCAMTDEEGRGRAARAVRSLGERTVTELILQHQNPQQLSANLWAAVRARGCQFLGPAMQEEVLKLVLLALEDGSALSRKVLVMFVVQRLEPHFPQASKTSIGHVVQLLYRASCFKVSKRECDSSLMQLKEEFRSYESLRREHDAQIVQIATEAGLRIAPDQWSALLYGDTLHKSHMQSIIDKLQTPQSFAQSVQELFIALQRTGDPAHLVLMSMHLDKLASIDASPDAKSPPWQLLADVMTSLKEVVSGLIHYLQLQASGRDSNHNQRHNQDRCIDPPPSHPLPPAVVTTSTHSKFKVSMCRDAATRSFCPRGNSCTFAHNEEEMDRYNLNPPHYNGHYSYMSGPPPSIPQLAPAPMVPQMYPRYPMMHPQPHPHTHIVENYIPTMNPMTNIMPDVIPDNVEVQQHSQFPPGLVNAPHPRVYDPNTQNFNYGVPFRHMEYPGQVYHAPVITEAMSLPNLFIPVHRNVNQFPYEEVPIEMRPDLGMGPIHVDISPEPAWPIATFPPAQDNDVFTFDGMRDTLPVVANCPDYCDGRFCDRRAVGADRMHPANQIPVDVAEDQQLEAELLALERRIDTEFKSTD